MTLTPEQKVKLKAAAEKATQGPWFSAMTARGLCVISGKDDIWENTICQWTGDHPERTYNLKFIAAANPTAILSLLSEVEWLREVLKRLAAYDAEYANEALANFGSYSSFDEPHAVRTARAALGENHEG